MRLRPVHSAQLGLLALLLAGGDLAAQPRSWFVSAGPAGRRIDDGSVSDFRLDAVAFSVGYERLGRHLGWTAILGANFGTGMAVEYVVPDQVPCLPPGPCPPPILSSITPASIAELRMGAVVAPDPDHRLVASIGPGLYLGDNHEGARFVMGGFASLMYRPFGVSGDRSRLAVGVEASHLPTPLGAGVGWLISPTVRLRF